MLRYISSAVAECVQVLKNVGQGSGLPRNQLAVENHIFISPDLKHCFNLLHKYLQQQFAQQLTVVHRSRIDTFALAVVFTKEPQNTKNLAVVP